MADCPSCSPPASLCSTGAAAVAAPNQSASLTELVAPALCSNVHLTSPNPWLLQRGFFCTQNVRVSGGWFDQIFLLASDVILALSSAHRSLQFLGLDFFSFHFFI